MVGTQNVAPASGTMRTEKTKQYREKFKLVFDKLHVSEMSFYPKMLFQKNKQLCLALYKSELEKQEGFYTLIVNSSFDPADGEYKLYHLKYNPKYATDYQASLIETDKWAIPYDAFEEVNTQHILLNSMNHQPPVKINPAVADPTDIDSPFSEMTVRDYAAITWRVPVSYKPWLNEMIKEFSIY